MRRSILAALAVALMSVVLVTPLVMADVPVTLTVTKAGSGNGTVISDVRPGIDCGTTCAADSSMGSVLKLTATPSSDSSFIGWSGDCSGTGTCQVTMNSARNVQARFDTSYRPDAWIKLCGLSDGCTINSLPHPWKGKDVYNSTGKKQSVSVRMEDGEGVRYWMTFQNDGALADTLIIEGCKGTPRFKVNKVQVGFYKRPQAGVTLITDEFKRGTAIFDVGPASANDRIKLTLNIIAPTTAEGVTYRCSITVRSESDPTQSDTLMTRMTTY